jgi:predicted AAA+ superfamily ATPase
VTGAVVVDGPKWCGKTWLARNQARSEVLLQDPTANYRNRRRATEEPLSLLAGAQPRLIDEWQDAPAIWDAVRLQVDQAPGVGQFILTGSSTFSEHATAHSGTGRISRLRLWPLSSTETGLSTGQVSLHGLLRGVQLPSATGQATEESLLNAVLVGGWPSSPGMPVSQAMALPALYLDGLVHSDAARLDGGQRDPDKLRALIAAVGRTTATVATNATLGRDLEAVTGQSLAPNTITGYLSVLTRLYVLVSIEAWAPALRSPVRLRQTPKRMLVDPSLAAAAMNATPDKLVDDPKTTGFLFENLCLRDLSVYCAMNGARLSHYRDNSGLETDAIVTAPTGEWAGIEIKLGAHRVDQGAASLIRLRDKMAAGGQRAPAFLAVVVGTGEFAHVRPDGVTVIPFDALGP